MPFKVDVKDDVKRIVAEGMPNFNINPETFHNNNSTYQELASSNNSIAKKLL